MATRSPMARSAAAVSTYCSVPSSMRMPTRLLAAGTVLPAAAPAGRSSIESMRPVPARSGPGVVGATTTEPVPACGTTTAEPAGAFCGTMTVPACGAGWTTTGAGAGATFDSLAHPARAARAMADRVKGSLLIDVSLEGAQKQQNSYPAASGASLLRQRAFDALLGRRMAGEVIECPLAPRTAAARALQSAQDIGEVPRRNADLLQPHEGITIGFFLEGARI